MQIHKSYILILGFFFLLSFQGIAQMKISIDSISAYIGQNVTVCSKILSTHITKGEKPVTYLNLGAAYPDQKLTLVIFQKDKPNFPSAPEKYYNLQEVCATGVLKTYRSMTEMIISRKDQIQIIKNP